MVQLAGRMAAAGRSDLRPAPAAARAGMARAPVADRADPSSSLVDFPRVRADAQRQKVRPPSAAEGGASDVSTVVRGPRRHPLHTAPWPVLRVAGRGVVQACL